MSAGIISFIISLIQIYIDNAPYICDLAPTFTFITCTVYILLKGIKIENKFLQNCIFFAGRHSFGIYMVHWVIMLKMMDDYLPMKSEPFFVYLIMIVSITFTIGLLVATFFDATALKLVKKIVSSMLRIRKL